MANKTLTFPFDLPPRTYHEIEVTPAIAADLYYGTDVEKEAIEKIHHHWEAKANLAGKNSETAPVYGISVPRRFGLSGPEKEFLKGEEDKATATAKAYWKLVLKVAEATGMSIPDVQADLQALETSPIIPAHLCDFAEEAIEIQESSKPDEHDDLIALIYLRRAIPNWSMPLTKAMPGLLLQAVLGIYKSENPATEKK